MSSPDLPITIEDLKILVPGVSDALAQLAIDSADAIVQEKTVSAGYTARVVYLIELYLAAYFATYSNVSGAAGGLTRVRVGNSEEDYSDPGKGLSGIANSKFGLQALTLDTKNTLSSLSTTPVKGYFQVV